MTPELEALLPDEWPILEAEDFCKGTYGEPGSGCHCTVGWAAEVFGLFDEAGGVDSRRLLPWTDEFNRFAGIHHPAGSDGITTSWNDAVGRSCHELARTWNRFGAHLGYTEGNPEAAK